MWLAHFSKWQQQMNSYRTVSFLECNSVDPKPIGYDGGVVAELLDW